MGQVAGRHGHGAATLLRGLGEWLFLRGVIEPYVGHQSAARERVCLIFCLRSGPQGGVCLQGCGESVFYGSVLPACPEYVCLTRLPVTRGLCFPALWDRNRAQVSGYGGHAYNPSTQEGGGGRRIPKASLGYVEKACLKGKERKDRTRGTRSSGVHNAVLTGSSWPPTLSFRQQGAHLLLPGLEKWGVWAPCRVLCGHQQVLCAAVPLHPGSWAPAGGKVLHPKFLGRAGGCWDAVE